LTAALYAIVAILAALRARDASGVGQHLDIAMLDCQVAWLEDALARYSATGNIPGPIGSRHPSITPFQQFRASDGHFVAGCGNEAIWRRFCAAIGMGELQVDPRFATNTLRTANHASLEPLLAQHFASETRDFWLERLRAANVPCAPISNVAEVVNNPHLQAREMILQAEHPQFHGLIVPGSPFKTVGDRGAPATRAPQLGEHTDEVLTRLLGFDAKRLQELRSQNVI
jgi:crotonobetainyl-CoA:carnitine CoA-transferase CaiB-like acyl-CoA transferase